MATQEQIIATLMENWVGLALEYCEPAPGIQGVYIYASSEPGQTYIGVYYDQNGIIKPPAEVQGVPDAEHLAPQMERILRNDLSKADLDFARIKLANPTEYRVHYNTMTRKLDTQISHELIYTDQKNPDPRWGIVNWLGDRAPKPTNP